jgi:serine/threonine-protein kinase
MGVVYEVEHLHTGQHLALKVFTQHPGASVERFKREARAASSIQSRHIVRVTDADVAPELSGAPFLVMELLEGSDLERATGDRPASPADVIAWLRQVARGLEKAHARGIVHRDLKPENIFLTKEEDGAPLVKILDFGIAKMAAATTLLTQSEGFLGTPGYMSPEQTDARGPPVTFRSDLYALGLIAFRLLIGRSYWKSGTLAQLFSQILVAPMPPPSERGSTLGSAFDAWFLRSCDRDADKRFASAHEQVEALAVALGFPEQQRVSESGAGVVPSDSPTLGSGETFEPSSADPSRASKRVSLGRRLAGLMAAIAAIGMGAALVRGGGQKKEAAPTPSADETPAATLPSEAHQPPPLETASAARLATLPEMANGASAAVDSGPLSSAASNVATPAPKRKGTPAAKGTPASRTDDSIWGER